MSVAVCRHASRSVFTCMIDDTVIFVPSPRPESLFNRRILKARIQYQLLRKATIQDQGNMHKYFQLFAESSPEALAKYSSDNVCSGCNRGGVGVERYPL
jgi:hypothetical protein